MRKKLSLLLLCRYTVKCNKISVCKEIILTALEVENVWRNIVDTSIEEHIHKQILEQYLRDKLMIEGFISNYELNILNKYKQEYPLRLLSIYYLKRFRTKIRKLILLPNKDVYYEINRTSELFSANMILPIHIGKEGYLLKIPLIVNVSKLSNYIKGQNSNKAQFYIKDLMAIMAKEYIDDYEKDNKIRIERRDILFEEKKNNPIIIMQESKATEFTIINGNHRIMHYSKLGCRTIKGYYVTPIDCCKFALTEDYEMLYKMLLFLIEKVNGSIDFEKNTF